LTLHFKMKDFELLKQVYYNSNYDRYCDGYKIILEKLSPEKREELGIKDSELQEIIKEGEKYLYRVAKEKGKFKYLAISVKSFEVIRKHIEYFKS
jgi:hypothetical protein